MLKRLEKFKKSVQNYLANIKFKPKNILTADEWKLVSLFNELLKTLYLVMQKCSKKRIAVKCNPAFSSTKNLF